MAMYKRDFNAPLSRYNARKRELQTSMLEYTERVRTINAIHEKNLLSENNLGLEIRAHRHHISRQSDPDLILHANHRKFHHNIRQRPHSLDDKELLRNKKLNQSLLTAARRDTKSEYGKPIIIPTQSSTISNVSNPPNSPDVGRNNNVRLNFVSSSDLYDLVDFGQNQKSSPRHCTARVSCVKDGIKLIEQIDLRSRKERKTAWVKNQDFENGSSTSLQKNSHYSGKGSNNVLDGYITGKSIKNRYASKAINKNDAVVTNELKENLISTKRSTQFKEAVPVITSADKNEIYPLNVFLETVLSSCRDPMGKLRHRPKRAKRMQLHKSNLVVIPEDGDTTSNNRENALHHNTLGNHIVQGHSTPIPSSASLAAIKDGITRHNKQKSITNFSERDVINGENSINIKNSAPISDDRRKIIKKHKKNGQGNQTLDAIIIKNSIIYPNLPWESDHSDMKTAVVNLEPSHSNGKNKKVKRLIFLRDQPENNHHN